MNSKIKELIDAAKAIRYNFSEQNRDRLGDAIDAVEALYNNPNFWVLELDDVLKEVIYPDVFHKNNL